MGLRSRFALCLAACVLQTPLAHAVIVYQTGSTTATPNRYTPFFTGVSSSVRYGDSGYLTTSGSPAVTGLNKITLGLIVSNSLASPVLSGQTDIIFRFYNNDPAGQFGGVATQLYQTTITNVALPALAGGSMASPALQTLSLAVALPNLSLTGGFNNFGWSISVSNFSYSGALGFQNAASNNVTGFYSNRYDYYDGATWSSFNFGAGTPPTNIGNFVATLETVPEVSAFWLVGPVIGGTYGVMRWRRRRTAAAA